MKRVSLAWGREDTFPWSIFWTQMGITLSPPPGSLHVATWHMCQFLKINKSLNVFCHFSVCDLWICFIKRVIIPPGRKRGRFWERAWRFQQTFRRDLGPGDQAADKGHPQDSLSSLPTLTFLLPWGPLFMCVREETETWQKDYFCEAV